ITDFHHSGLRFGTPFIVPNVELSGSIRTLSISPIVRDWGGLLADTNNQLHRIAGFGNPRVLTVDSRPRRGPEQRLQSLLRRAERSEKSGTRRKVPDRFQGLDVPRSDSQDDNDLLRPDSELAKSPGARREAPH